MTTKPIDNSDVPAPAQADRGHGEREGVRACEQCHGRATLEAKWSFGSNFLCRDCFTAGQAETDEVEAHEMKEFGGAYGVPERPLVLPLTTPPAAALQVQADEVARLTRERDEARAKYEFDLCPIELAAAIARAEAAERQLAKVTEALQDIATDSREYGEADYYGLVVRIQDRAEAALADAETQDEGAGPCRYCDGSGWFYSEPELGPCQCAAGLAHANPKEPS